MDLLNQSDTLLEGSVEPSPKLHITGYHDCGSLK